MNATTVPTMKPLVAALVLILVAGCGASEADSSKPEKPDVDTSQFSPAVKTRIDRMSAARNCDGLQGQFDTADGNGNVELMKYIDAAMKSADCY